MKSTSQQKKVSNNAQQSKYVKLLCCLRNKVTSEYSKAIQQEKRAIILGYD
jgi:hypothetical protein